MSRSPVDPVPLADDARCPCGTGEVLGSCCAPVLRGQRRAATAEALMRSRYTAFAVGDIDHVMASWHPSTRPLRSALEASLGEESRWLRLEVHRTEQGGPFDDDGVVEFTAHGKREGGRFRLHEISRFTREDGVWRYLDGTVQRDGR